MSNEVATPELKSIRITLASPEMIKGWSFGEVTKAETINYRTLRPEKDGLFCERIFGPTKDWECYCGKYKKSRHKGTTCDRCGVEVTRSRVRRERMGHIKLASPVAHIWFSKGSPSYIALILDVTPRDLERVLYFSRYIITSVNEEEKQRIYKDLISKHKQTIADLQTKYSSQKASYNTYQEDLAKIREQIALYHIQPADIKTLINKVNSEYIAEEEGIVKSITETKDSIRVTIQTKTLVPANFPIPLKHKAVVKTGGTVKAGEPIIELTKRSKIIAQEKGEDITNTTIFAPISGSIKVTKRIVYITPFSDEYNDDNTDDTVITSNNHVTDTWTIDTPLHSEVTVKVGQLVKKGTPITLPTYFDKLQCLHNYRLQITSDYLHDVRRLTVLTEDKYKELQNHFGNMLFSADMGAEAIYEILKKVDLNQLKENLQKDIKLVSGQRHSKIIRRLRVVEALRNSGNKPEWMIITVLPVLPPDLHPMVRLDGGRFVTSDLNQLYRRVINRNNRLKNLTNIQAPEIIIRNEKRMLQEAVDSLIDNGKRSRAIQGAHNHQLKSLTDLLRGKHGRFRQNMLGKRVDYSGRSVIVVGPSLKLYECGLPRKMAVELFKPFVMNALVLKGHASNIKSARRLCDTLTPVVEDILEEVTKSHPIILNRAPTLHRLGIQAFKVVLVEGLAIQLHPLVCTAFNADFDGDQMAVHVPLSIEARREAIKLMISSNNLLSARSGDPIVAPTLDMVLGIYHLTRIEDTSNKKSSNTSNGNSYHSYNVYSNFEQVLIAYNTSNIRLQEEIQVRDNSGNMVTTTPGRIIFNQILPDSLGFKNLTFNKDELEKLIKECHIKLENETVVEILDKIKNVGFKYATTSGTTIAITDITTPPSKKSLLNSADKKINQLEEQFLEGLIREDDKYQESIKIWTEVSENLTKDVEKILNTYNGVYDMFNSGAKGNIAQIKQMVGMRGLMSNPRGRIIEMPIRSSFSEGLSVMEYFISTHGTRKGLADTALRTADAGYLTRRLADLAQNVIILQEDCGDNIGINVIDDLAEDLRISGRIVSRYPATTILHPVTKDTIADSNTLITTDLAKSIQDAGVKSAYVRSPIACTASRGICAKCYGNSLANNKPSMIGEAVGIIAAQSIGEPGTQLTMRTFHTGGIAGQDITSGLPRVVELFEARDPKGVAPITEIAGTVSLIQTNHGKIAKVVNTEKYSHEVDIPSTHRACVKTGEKIFIGQPILRIKKLPSNSKNTLQQQITAPVSGELRVTRRQISISWEENTEKIYILPHSARVVVKDGQKVEPGQALTSGPKNPKEVLRIQGAETTQRYLINEVQKVYRSQGVNIHDKHIEVIIRQMMQKVEVETSGDTDLLPEEIIFKSDYARINNTVINKGAQPATAKPILLGVTRAALSTDSFLAAASFQETARVLADAAISGTVDNLIGLKENVIIGNLIPARLASEEDSNAYVGLSSAQSSQFDNGIQLPKSYEEALDMVSREGYGKNQEEHRRTAENYISSRN